jgi:DNA invertase Pin-like site-specific DNA recombinase
MDRAARECWALIVLDLGLDTTTLMGRFTANLFANIAELERGMIAERTSAALQAAKAQGKRLGVGNRVLDPQLLQRIVNMHQAGEGLTAIANRLNDEGVPTSRGGSKWWPSTVKGALESDRLDREAAALRARHVS